MNLAILHYHLNRGGVTRVIENQLASLDAALDPAEPWRVALVYGGRREGFKEDLHERLKSIRLSLHEVPPLDYDDAREEDGQTAEDLYRQLTSVLDALQFTPPQTVLHVHNHSLGKNRQLPPAVWRLAEDGHAVLLQIHDFAEDFRAENYRHIGEPTPQALYPQAEGIHYAVLNGRDHEVLQEAGTEAGRLHLLPNPVPVMDRLPPRAEARRRLARRFDFRPKSRPCSLRIPALA